jgi:hypothetical protein
LTKQNAAEVSELDPWKLFLNAMRSPMTRDRYSTRECRKNRYQKQRQKLLDRIEKEKDPDTKAELRIGNVIKDYR